MVPLSFVAVVVISLSLRRSNDVDDRAGFAATLADVVAVTLLSSFVDDVLPGGTSA